MELFDYCQKKGNWKQLITYCDEVLVNFKKQYPLCEGPITLSLDVKDRKIASYFELATFARGSMFCCINSKDWWKARSEFSEFERCVYNWDTNLHNFNDNLKEKLLPKVTAKQRIMKIIEQNPYWLNYQLKDDLLDLIGKGPSRKARAKG